MSNSYPIVHVLNGCTSFNIIVSSNDKVQKWRLRDPVIILFNELHHEVVVKTKEDYLLYKTRGSIGRKHGASINHFRLIYRYQKSSSDIQKIIVLNGSILLFTSISYIVVCPFTRKVRTNFVTRSQSSFSNKRLKYLYPYFIYGGQTLELKKCNVQSLCPLFVVETN